MSEAAWNKAFTQGSRDLQNRLMKVHAKNPKFQAWLKSSGHGAGTSVKQASKEVKPSARVKSLQTKSLQAYGATKGAKVGGEHGSDDVRDTIAPLTRDQHSKVQAAERAAKAAAAKAAPKVKKPLTQAQRMAAIAAAVRKGKAKHDVATVDPDDMGHDDLMDVHQSLHVSRGYNEEVELEEGVATAQKVVDRANVVAKTNPDPKKRMAASGLARKAMLRTINPTGVNTGIVRGGGNKTYRMLGKIPPYQLTKKTGVSEEVEQIDEIKISDVIKATRGKSPEEKQKIIQQMRDKENASKPKTAPRKLEPPKDIPMHQRVYPDDMKYHGDSVELEGPVMNEGAKEDAAKMLGGPVKTKPTNAPAGKLPYGFRRARNLARQAMKAGKPVTESTTEVSEVNEMNHGKKLAKMIMAKQSQHPIAQNMGEENIVEQDDTMEKKEMAQTQLHFIGYAAKEILEFIDMGGEIEEWYQNKLSKVQSEVESLHSYIEGEKRRTGMVKEEEQIDEKAPPGAKYERMVKHIKKGYAKGGLTPKEKSIAYATAWKAYGKKEEVEQVDEAFDKSSPAHAKAQELVSNYGNRSAARAVYHGDGSATIHTTGDKKVSSATRVDHIHDQAGLGYNRSAEAYKNSSKSKGGLKFKTKETEGKSIYGSHEIHISHKGMKEEVEQIDEVKAVKAYDKEGKLVGRYRSMDHAKQMKPGHTYKVEEEVVTEAEGKVAVTPKEKELAAHHGDPKRITYGDVIKARLKSAAAKKMGKK